MYKKLGIIIKTIFTCSILGGVLWGKQKQEIVSDQLKHLELGVIQTQCKILCRPKDYFLAASFKKQTETKIHQKQFI